MRFQENAVPYFAIILVVVVVRPRLIALVPGGHIEIIFEFSEDRCGISAGGKEVGLTLFLLPPVPGVPALR